MPDSTLILTVRTVLNYIAELSLLLPLWVGFKRRLLMGQEHKAVYWCCLMWIVLTVIGEILFAYHRQNLFIWNTATILETLLLVYAFYVVLRSQKIRLGLRIAVGIFVVVGITDFFFLSGLHANTIFTVALESALLIATVLFYFEQILQEPRITDLERTPMFIVGIGVITYFSGTIVIFLLQNSVVGTEQWMLMTMINSVLSIVLNSIFARAFWLVGREQPIVVSFGAHK